MNRGALVVLLMGAGCLVARAATAKDYGGLVPGMTRDEIAALEETGELPGADAEALLALGDAPLDINSADSEAFYALPGVSYEVATALVDYRTRHGPYASVYELLLASGMTVGTLTPILPFVSCVAWTGVNKNESWSAWARLGAVAVRESASMEGATTVAVKEPEAFLQVRADGLGVGAGLVASYRDLASAYWDYGSGRLRSGGPARRYELDCAYVYLKHEGINAFLGCYDAVFAEGLVFATRPLSAGSGVAPDNRVVVDVSSGQVRVGQSLSGAAVEITDLTLLSMSTTATLFASQRMRELYQYYLRYGYDDSSSQVCTTDSDCRAGYSCDVSSRSCYSSKLYADASRQNTTDSEAIPEYRYVTYDDAFRERVAGANVRLQANDHVDIGMTGYVGRMELFIASVARPVFAPMSRYADAAKSSGVGVHAKLRWNAGLVAGEYGYVKGHALFARLIVSPTETSELGVSVRYYDPRYANPYGRGEAAKDMVRGLSARNEVGARMTVAKRFATAVDSTSDLDIWCVADANTDGMGPANARFAQRLTIAVAAHESVDLGLRYVNKDVISNGRGESYESSATTDETETTARGERRVGAISVTTRRLAPVHLRAAVTVTAVDVAYLPDTFAYEYAGRVAIDARLGKGLSLLATVGYETEPRNSTSDGTRVCATATSASGELEYAVSEEIGLHVRGNYVRRRDTVRRSSTVTMAATFALSVTI